MPSDANPTLTSVPVLRRLWMVVLLTCLLITFPIALIMLASGPIYRWREQGWQPISNGARFTYGGLLALWLVALVAKFVLAPGTVSEKWAQSANPDKPAAQESQAPQSTASGAPNPPSQSTAPAEHAGGLSACDSQAAIQAVKDILTDRPDIQLQDFGKARETFFDQAINVRRCVAVAALSTGQTLVTYQVRLGPSGKEVVEIQTGDDANQQYEVDKGKKEEAEAAAKQASPSVTEQDNSSNVKADNYQQ